MPDLLNPATPIGALLLGGVIIMIGLFASSLVKRLLKATLRHDHDEHVDVIALSFMSHLLVLFLWCVLAMIYAHLVPALDKLGNALLAGVSLVSVIVGFAAQTTLGNLVAGISLVMYKPFLRGDRIQIDVPSTAQFEVGVVEDITLGYTVLRTDDGREIIIANGIMAQQKMIKLPPKLPSALPSK